MDHTWIAPNEIDDLLNPNYYRGIYLDATRKVNLDGRQRTLASISYKIADGPFGSQLKTDEYISNGIPLFRVSDVQNLSINLTDIVYISPEKQRQLSRSKVIPGDILITKAGRIGSSAVVPQTIQQANITSHLALIRLKNSIDPYFVAAFLESKYGRLLSERSSHKSTRPELTKTEVEKIPVYLPNLKIQTYIGDKVRLAEKYREEARKLFTEAQTIFAEAVGASEFTPRSNNTNIIQSKQMTERLSAEFHLPKYYDLENHLASLGWPVQCIGDLLREPIIRLSSPVSNNTPGYPCILTSDIEPYFIEWETPSLWISTEDYHEWKGILGPNDVVYTSVGPPVGEAAVVLGTQLPMVIGGDVSILRTNQDLHHGYLALFLNSIFGQMQNERYARGIRQRRVYPDDIASFLIPVLPKDTQSAIGQRVVRFEVFNMISRKLIKRAIQNMESLIDDTLDTVQIMSGVIQPESWEIVQRELEQQEYA